MNRVVYHDRLVQCLLDAGFRCDRVTLQALTDAACTLGTIPGTPIRLEEVRRQFADSFNRVYANQATVEIARKLEGTIR